MEEQPPPTAEGSVATPAPVTSATVRRSRPGSHASVDRTPSTNQESDPKLPPDNQLDEKQVNDVLDWTQKLNSSDIDEFPTKLPTGIGEENVPNDRRDLPPTPKTPGGTKIMFPHLTPGTAQIARIPSPPPEWKRERELTMLTRRSAKGKFPPKIRLATVSMSARSKAMAKNPSMYYEEPQRKRKVISWDEANNARPPLRIDMEGPTPWTYSPRNKPLYETNSPSFSFGRKCYPEKDGGSRTAWQKTWFQSPRHVWIVKTDYHSDRRWPSPASYPLRPTLGPRQSTRTEAPSYTFGARQDFSIGKHGAEFEPSPSAYNPNQADKQLYTRAPTIIHSFRHNGTQLWKSKDAVLNPGPGAYSPRYSQTQRSNPSFSFRGLGDREEKAYTDEYGPFSAF